MKNILTLILFVFFLFSCEDSKKEMPSADLATNTTEVKQLYDFNLEVYDYEGLKPFLNKQDDKVHVVNFWATWCAPCIKELPSFEKVHSNYKSKSVEVLLVSLDFPRNYEKKLKPFIAKHKLQSKIIALDDVDMNKWVAEVSEDWSGAIPATIIYTRDKRQFYERSFSYEELEKELKQFLK
jgi:thiol-disulfide isomerase/thioredoxin